MSYLDHFGLRHEPFSNAPSERFYFRSPQHERAMIRLLHVIEGMRGLALLSGEIGQGKTTLARRLLENLPEERFEASLLVLIHSGVTGKWLLRRIAALIGVVAPAEEKLDLLEQVYQRLLEIHREGRKTVVLVDEAQMLQSRDVMEEFRGLLNIEVPGQKLINFVFFGLPEVETHIQLDPPLAQRVALRVRLDRLDLDSTRSYVVHRLKLAGAMYNPFTAEAVEGIHRHSGGTPRVINTLCDNALLEAYLDGVRKVDAARLDAVARNLGLTSTEMRDSSASLDLTEVDRILEALIVK